MMGPKCEGGGNRAKCRRTPAHSDTTPFALPFIGVVVLAVPCRVPQNNMEFIVRVGLLSVVPGLVSSPGSF